LGFLTSVEADPDPARRVEVFPIKTRSRIHERTIALGFLGIISRVLRLEFSVYNDYFTTIFKLLLLREEGE
jgi:hypothetical protein